MNDKIKINLKMAGAYYPITIRREEEEMVREAARQVDTRLNQYKSNYARDQVTTEQLLAMVAYQFALESLEEKKRNDTIPFATKINELSQLLDAHFHQEE